MKTKVDCPKCLGATEYFNGKYMKKCNLCEEGKVDREIEEAFIDEKLLDDV